MSFFFSLCFLYFLIVQEDHRTMKKSKFSKTKTGKKVKGTTTSQPAFSMTIFGVPLESISRFDPVKGWGLPPLIKRSIERIRMDMKQEGIFRLSAQANLVDDLRRAYDSGNAVDLSQVESNVCCGLLKLFLREMSEPLFPFRLYKAFVSFQEGKNNHQFNHPLLIP